MELKVIRTVGAVGAGGALRAAGAFRHGGAVGDSGQVRRGVRRTVRDLGQIGGGIATDGDLGQAGGGVRRAGRDLLG